jgi:hypothetical protein
VTAGWKAGRGRYEGHHSPKPRRRGSSPMPEF